MFLASCSVRCAVGYTDWIVLDWIGLDWKAVKDCTIGNTSIGAVQETSRPMVDR